MDLSERATRDSWQPVKGGSTPENIHFSTRIEKFNKLLTDCAQDSDLAQYHLDVAWSVSN